MSRARATALLLRLARLPTLPPPIPEPGFDDAADALLRGEPAQLPEQRLDFLCRLGGARGVVSHGSRRNDLVELSTERTSRDATPWGDQQAVYASSDPVWAIYFAVLRRDDGWRGMRSGSLGVGGRRFYFFFHNRGSRSPQRFGPGSLYILPSDTFDAEAGLIDTAHLVSRVPVRPLARIDVAPEDFPFSRPHRVLPRPRADLDLAAPGLDFDHGASSRTPAGLRAPARAAAAAHRLR